MARRVAPEEPSLFDLAEIAPEGAEASPARPPRSSRGGAGARALQRRVEQVSTRARAAQVPSDSDEHPEGGNEPLGEEPDEDAAADETLTIAALYARLRRALSTEFPDEVWVSGEIRSLRESRGHRFLELADAGAETASRAAQLEVVCWASEWFRVAAALNSAGVALEAGRVVRVRGRVSVWEGASRLRLVLSAIDVEALLGGIAAARQRLLRQLAAEGLLEANRALPLALVPLRIGLVTSPGSEAHRDFVGELTRSGFAFDLHVEQSLVQGQEAPRQIADALGRLARVAPDLAVVIRGGGARGDLAAFDSEEVARAIATAAFPVWTGIGHTGDRSVADEVAHRSFITPTACGQAVVGVVGAYAQHVADQVAELGRLARARLDGAAHLVEVRRQAVGRGARNQLERRADALVSVRRNLARGATASLARGSEHLAGQRAGLGDGVRRLLERTASDQAHARQVLAAYDPRRQLARGWTLTYDAAGRIVRTVAALAVGDVVTTRFSDGEAGARVEKIRPDATAQRGEGQ